MSLATIHLPVLHLDPKRITATSAAIALHAFAFLLLLAPVQFSPKVERVDDEPPAVLVDELRPIPLIPPPQPRPVERTPPRATPVQQVMEQLVPEPIDTVIQNTAIEGPVEIAAGPTSDYSEPAYPTGPQTLRVIEGPAPNYPIAELRAGTQGRVVLRIEVDATGKPFDGSIESSSGSRGLDRAALKFVIAKWRFEPARHNGQPIAATALVPVEFVIPQ